MKIPEFFGSTPFNRIMLILSFIIILVGSTELIGNERLAVVCLGTFSMLCAIIVIATNHYKNKGK